MTEHLVLNEEGNLDVKPEKYQAALRIPAIIFSYLFHPLFIIGWVVLYLLYRNNLVFLGIHPEDRVIVFLRVFSTSIFLPLVTVLLLKGLGFIQSVQLHTQKDRIIPYVACITFFFWTYYVSKQLGDPVELRSFLLSAFVASSASLLINNYMKVSMHAIGVGGMITFFILLLFANRLDDVFALLAAVFITGITCSSRLIASDHKPFEIYTGLITGIVIQFVTWMIAH
ncbi:MAG: hypothetical protein KA160_08900 [Lacibacter sp.]|nr:hypothetical protein [Lacibacter sp.]